MKWWDRMPWSSFFECWALRSLRRPRSTPLRNTLPWGPAWVAPSLPSLGLVSQFQPFTLLSSGPQPVPPALRPVPPAKVFPTPQASFWPPTRDSLRVTRSQMCTESFHVLSTVPSAEKQQWEGGRERRGCLPEGNTFMCHVHWDPLCWTPANALSKSHSFNNVTAFFSKVCCTPSATTNAHIKQWLGFAF